MSVYKNYVLDSFDMENGKELCLEIVDNTEKDTHQFIITLDQARDLIKNLQITLSGIMSKERK